MKWWKKPWVLPACLTVVILFGSNWYIKQLMHEDVMPKEVIKTRLEAMYQGTVEQLTESADGYEAEIVRNGALYSATVDHRTGKVQALTLLKEAPENLAAKPSDEISSDESSKAEQEKVTDIAGASDKPDAEEKPAEKSAAAAGTKTEEIPLPRAEKPAAEPQKPQVEQKPQQQTQQQKPQQQTQQQKPQQQAQPQQPKPQPAPKKSVILTEKQAVNIALKRLSAKVPVKVDDVEFVKTQEGGYYLVELDLDTDDDYDEVTYQVHAISGKIMSESWDD